MCCEVRPLLPLPIMQTVASVPCLLPLVYAKRSFSMGKGEDQNEEFFAVTDKRFLTQQKPSLLICWDFVSKPHETLRCFQVYRHWRDAAAASPTQNHYSKIVGKVCKLSVCKEPTFYQSVHENVSTRYYTLCLCIKPFHLQSTAPCPPFYKLVTSIAFSVNYSIHSHICNIDTMMLQF